LSILSKFSSQVGDRAQSANHKVVVECLEDPTLHADISAGLAHPNAALAGDCAEVLTQVVAQRPVSGAPYAQALGPPLKHKTIRVGWEAMHALAYGAAFNPETLATLLPTLAEIIHPDPSIIVRDYATDAFGNYAATGRPAAVKAYPVLKEALSVWNSKHAGHALKGLANIAALAPERQAEIHAIAGEFSISEKGVGRKAAKELHKALDKKTSGSIN
jgi:hypothetical protein